MNQILEVCVWQSFEIRVHIICGLEVPDFLLDFIIRQLKGNLSYV